MNSSLLPVLSQRANHRGLVLVRESSLLDQTRTTSDVLRAALHELESHGSIESLSPPPFLVLRLRKWSGKRTDPAKTAAKPAAPLDRAYSHSFQSHLFKSKLLNESYRQPASEEALLREILETLGESDPATFRGAVRNFSPGVIHAALDRIRRMKVAPKNPTALFRFLLPRLAKERRPIT